LTEQKQQADIITKESLSASDYYFEDGKLKLIDRLRVTRLTSV